MRRSKIAHDPEVMFSPQVIEMLGASRVAEMQQRLSAIQAYTVGLPDRTSFVRHMPVPLKASESGAARSELISKLQQHGSDWFFMTSTRDDGSQFGLASDLFQAREADPLGSMMQFLLFDIHSCLGGWWLSHLWRGADLAEATCGNLEDWKVLPAAACARSLVEGAAAFVVEGEQLLEEWSAFKQLGAPNPDAIAKFRKEFGEKLLQMQVGSRVGERTGERATPLKRTNVMTILEKFTKIVGKTVWADYEWLCDAVHPSFGSHTAYVATQGIHRAGTTMAADLARRTDRARVHIAKIDPTVALAVLGVFSVSVDALLNEAGRLRWLIHDFGLTTGVAFCALELSFGAARPPAGAEACLCGSGLRFSACRHRWGEPSVPPGAVSVGSE